MHGQHPEQCGCRGMRELSACLRQLKKMAKVSTYTKFCSTDRLSGFPCKHTLVMGTSAPALEGPACSTNLT
jgi:hypothetical protein